MNYPVTFTDEKKTKPYIHQDLPAVLYHPSGAVRKVHTTEEHAEWIAKGWETRPIAGATTPEDPYADPPGAEQGKCPGPVVKQDGEWSCLGCGYQVSPADIVASKQVPFDPNSVARAHTNAAVEDRDNPSTSRAVVDYLAWNRQQRDAGAVGTEDPAAGKPAAKDSAAGKPAAKPNGKGGADTK